MLPGSFAKLLHKNTIVRFICDAGSVAPILLQKGAWKVQEEAIVQPDENGWVEMEILEPCWVVEAKI